jgi:hypothetical protein
MAEGHDTSPFRLPLDIVGKENEKENQKKHRKHKGTHEKGKSIFRASH